MKRPARLSLIAHADHRLMSPIDDAQLARLIALLDLPPAARVLDLCCGKAEALLRVLEAWPEATGVGVDREPTLIDTARAEATRRGLADRVTLIDGDAWETPAVGDGFDAVISLGGARPGPDARSLYAGLRDRARPGGVILLGEGFFTRPPDPRDLIADGWDPDDTPTHADHVARARDVGLTVLYTAAATLGAWDDYEGRYLRAVERWLRAHPDDPEADDMRAWIRGWHRRYLEWRRDHLGFGLYLLMR